MPTPLNRNTGGLQDQLFQLIKSLTKAEKRNFRLYVTRNQSSEDLKFIQLFDVMDKQKEYQEELILKKCPDIKKEQISNLKAHLYKQLLTSLRLLHKQKNADIDIREHIDYAKVLYNKGLYQQALRTLDKAKGMAIATHYDFLQLEIIEFEKMIESRHITRSAAGRAETLAEESRRISMRLQNGSRLSNLALQMYGFYLQFGHARHEADFQHVKQFFDENLPIFDHSTLGFFEKIYLYQAQAWYAYIEQDWKRYYRYSYKWVALFEQAPLMKQVDTSLYLKGVHNLLLALFVTLDHRRLSQILSNMENYLQKHSDTLDENTRSMAFHHVYTARLNKHFMEGTFADGVKIIPEIETGLQAFSGTLDEHRVLIFYYKIASLYFGSGDNDRAIDYLNKIINLKAGSLRTDIQCFARLLHLIAHYEKGHFGLLEYLIKSVYRFILKNQDLNGILSEILKFLRKSLYLKQKDMRDAFAALQQKLEELAEDPYERRSFLYLDILSWLESKVQGQSVQTVIHQKFLARQKQVIPSA
jgi:hypothetical protein